jgi:hypothetical protein
MHVPIADARLRCQRGNSSRLRVLKLPVAHGADAALAEEAMELELFELEPVQMLDRRRASARATKPAGSASRLDV